MSVREMESLHSARPSSSSTFISGSGSKTSPTTARRPPFRPPSGGHLWKPAPAQPPNATTHPMSFVLLGAGFGQSRKSGVVVVKQPPPTAPSPAMAGPGTRRSSSRSSLTSSTPAGPGSFLSSATRFGYPTAQPAAGPGYYDIVGRSFQSHYASSSSTPSSPRTRLRTSIATTPRRPRPVPSTPGPADYAVPVLPYDDPPIQHPVLPSSNFRSRTARDFLGTDQSGLGTPAPGQYGVPELKQTNIAATAFKSHTKRGAQSELSPSSAKTPTTPASILSIPPENLHTQSHRPSTSANRWKNMDMDKYRQTHTQRVEKLIKLIS